VQVKDVSRETIAGFAVPVFRIDVSRETITGSKAAPLLFTPALSYKEAREGGWLRFQVPGSSKTPAPDR